jgi:GNAT superfamily N-acetyltransferase
MPIRTARSAGDFLALAELVREYVEWCRGRYDGASAFIDRVFGCQALTSELETLDEEYSAPRGLALLAQREGVVCGGGAYRRLPDGSCEMKRLFVRARFQGLGVGRALCEALIAAARAAAYPRMCLDTGDRMHEATALYRSFGFRPCPPYRDYPPELLPHLVFMDLRLG